MKSLECVSWVHVFHSEISNKSSRGVTVAVCTPFFLPLPYGTSDTWDEVTTCTSQNMQGHNDDMMKSDVT